MQVLGRIKRSVANSRDDVFLREDFSRFGSQAQVGRALDELKREGRIVFLWKANSEGAPRSVSP